MGYGTCTALVLKARKGSGTANNPWLTCLGSSPEARCRLFCFPHAGGAASFFRSWSRGLPPWVEVWAGQPPGRENRLQERALTRFDDLKAGFAEALASRMSLPFALLGHSLGALLAFEVAREVRQQGLRLPMRLFVSAHCAPHAVRTGFLLESADDALLLSELRRLDGTDSAVLANDELVQLLLPAFRADLKARASFGYRAEAPLSCPISALGGRSDSETPPADLEAWRQQTSGGFSLRTFEGGHFFIVMERRAVHAAVVRDLWADLETGSNT